MTIDLHHHIQINGNEEDIYKAITTEEGIRCWWTTDVKMGSNVGDEAQFGFNNRSAIFKMRIDNLVRNVEIFWTCVGGNVKEWIGTTQQFSMKRNDEGIVDLKFSHSGWRSAKGYCYLCNTTWGHLFVLLKEYIEKGSKNPYFT